VHCAARVWFFWFRKFYIEDSSETVIFIIYYQSDSEFEAYATHQPYTHSLCLSFPHLFPSPRLSDRQIRSPRPFFRCSRQRPSQSRESRLFKVCTAFFPKCTNPSSQKQQVVRPEFSHGIKHLLTLLLLEGVFLLFLPFFFVFHVRK
jgi:hypothetical protein